MVAVRKVVEAFDKFSHYLILNDIPAKFVPQIWRKMTM